MKRTRMILVLLVVVILVGVTVFGMHSYQKWQTEKTITEYQTKIENAVKTYSDSQERADKLEILKNLINEANTYNDSENPHKEIKQKYKQEIQFMKSCFVEMYDTEIVQNTLSDVGTITDKNVLNSAKTNLSALLETIENEYELTLSKTKYTEYVNAINLLIEGYNNRVAEIEKAEEEARLKAEAEAKAKAEQEAKAKEQASKINSSASSNASNNTNSPNSNTSSKKPGWRDPRTLEYYKVTYEDGTSNESWTDEAGNMYDSNGNPLGTNIYDFWR